LQSDPPHPFKTPASRRGGIGTSIACFQVPGRCRGQALRLSGSAWQKGHEFLADFCLKAATRVPRTDVQKINGQRTAAAK